MTVIKNQKSNTYEVRTYYKDWTGVRKQKTKRGFKRKCDAQEWERAFKLKENLSLDMYFEDFVDLYLNDIKSRIKYNTWLTKKHIVEKKILPYFSKKKLQEIKPSDIRQWQNTMMNYRNKQGEGYSQVYLKTIHNQLSAILNHAVNFYDLKSNAARKAGSIAACLCLCLCLCGTVPILAFAGNDFAHELLYSISPSIAQKLKPINVSCEDNGIEMTVVAAEVNGEKTTILLSMHDKIAKRLDETTDLFDSYSICTPYDQSGGCSLVSYDAGTNTATFMLTIEQTDHILLPGDKITFSVNQLLSKKEHNNFKIEKIDTNNVYSITEFLEEPDIRGGSDSESESIDGDNMLFIKPDEANAIILKKGVAVTGYGIVEGKLHIQVRFSDILNTDNHGYVYLKNEDGKVVNCQSSVAFWDQSHVNSYEEFVFEVSAEELVNYEIWGEFWTCNNAPIEGEWQVTFPVEKNE